MRSTGVNFTAHRWQIEAIDAWETANQRGLIEAVTGSGKTYAALEAIRRLNQSNKRVSILVVVPTIPLQQQWKKKLESAFPGRRVSLLGGGQSGGFHELPIACVAVINTAVRRVSKLFPHVQRNPTTWSTCLIADECHHYVEAPEWSKLTRNWKFDYVLGLSATLSPYEVDGLGRIVYEYGFEQAGNDGLVPNFDLVNVRVALNRGERDEYLRLTDYLTEQLTVVRDLFKDDLRKVPEDRFFTKLREIMRRECGPRLNPRHPIGRLFLLMFKRAEITYMADEKMALASTLVTELVGRGGRKTIAFFERILNSEDVQRSVEVEAAQLIRSRVSGSRMGLKCVLYHSGLKRTERDEALRLFEASGPMALCACRALDEGLDMPSIDAGLLVSSTRSLRQRIQRIGRMLRSNQAIRPIVVSMHVQGTSDEDVADEDEQTFAGVATLRRCSTREAVDCVRQLL